MVLRSRSDVRRAPNPTLGTVRVAITGATGMIGSAVTRALLARGDQVLALTRDAEHGRSVLGAPGGCPECPHPQQPPPPLAALEPADAVIHLLGAPVAQRWSDQAKGEI